MAQNKLPILHTQAHHNYYKQVMGDSNCGIRGEDYSNCSSLLALSIVIVAVGLKLIKLLFLIVPSILPVIIVNFY